MLPGPLRIHDRVLHDLMGQRTEKTLRELILGVYVHIENEDSVSKDFCSFSRDFAN